MAFIMNVLKNDFNMYLYIHIVRSIYVNVAMEALNGQN